MTTEDARTLTEVLRRCDENLVRAEAAVCAEERTCNCTSACPCACPESGCYCRCRTGDRVCLRPLEMAACRETTDVERIAELEAKLAEADEFHDSLLAAERQNRAAAESREKALRKALRHVLGCDPRTRCVQCEAAAALLAEER